MSDLADYGGISRVSAASGLDQKNRRGRQDLIAEFEACLQGQIRAPGSGRPRIQKKTYRLSRIGCDWFSPKPGRSSNGQSIRTTQSTLPSPTDRSRLCRYDSETVKAAGLWAKDQRQAPDRKTHPQRDQQYKFIQRCKALFVRHGQPVISIDVKKREFVGSFKKTAAHVTAARPMK